MTRRGRVAGWVAGVGVSVFMAGHRHFDGLSLIVLAVCVYGLYRFWSALWRASQPVQCPHCQHPLQGWTNPARRRGDGA